ncbi:MAG: ABC transporter ATP-binding protein [Phycisphaeraceae bacterium]|nr:ABC transporter ATP-binding protein [Phycisphaeraceae bacterium]
MATAIRIAGLVKEFPSASRAGRTRAVDGVTLEVEPGELFFLLGPSGCGKTTLLRMIAGFIQPTNGTIAFGSTTSPPSSLPRPVTPPLSYRDVTRLPPNKRNTGMVFQSYALWPHMTVEQNVAFGLGVRRVPSPESASRVREALDAVRMGEYAKRKPNQLSGGEQQRVALARALVVRPDVLLLDEPLSNLDARMRVGLRAEIRRICKQAGLTTVYVTHDQKEALSMADRVAIMDAGRVVQLGAPADLYRRPRSRFVAEFLGETNFLEAEVLGVEGGIARLRTPAGELAAFIADDGERGANDRPAPASRVTLSIRPEAIRLLPSPQDSGPRPQDSSLPARLLDTLYLGETAQHTLELQGGTRVKAAELNPPPLSQHALTLAIAVDPADVVILP